MTFQPVVPFGGNAGWAFLQRTRESQEDAFQQSAALQRDVAYFRANIGGITSAEDLVDDRRLLNVALGAFGLAEDIDNKFFIRKTLEEGTLRDDSLANRLSDKRYFAMAEAFGFDLSPPRTVVGGFADPIVQAFQERSFEVAVGNQNPDMRSALTFARDIGDLAERGLSGEAAWFTVMATPPLRTVFERAFSLPIEVGTLDVDRQREIFEEKANQFFGSPDVAQFTDLEKQDELLRRFLAQSELQGGVSPTTRGSAALAILQASATPQFGIVL